MMVRSEKRGTKALEAWCKKITSHYQNASISNMTTSWRNGLAFCAIIHHFRPDLINFESLSSENVLENNKLAFNTAEQHLGITSLLDPEDMVQYPVPDRLSILTYVSQLYKYFESDEFKSSYGGGAEKCFQRNAKVEGKQFTTETDVVDHKRNHTECCCKCSEPVFLVERLVIDCKLFHRTCFRCSRCGIQMNIVNYTSSIDGDYCCEVCPDEESVCSWNEDSSINMDGQEKSMGIDNYSSNLEISLEGDTYAENQSQSRTEDEEKENTFTNSVNGLAVNSVPEIVCDETSEIQIDVKDDVECIEELNKVNEVHVSNDHVVSQESLNEAVESVDVKENEVGDDDEEIVDELGSLNLGNVQIVVENQSVVESVEPELNSVRSEVGTCLTLSEDPQDYPDDLNPFGNSEDELPQTQAVSTNPFGTDGESDAENSSAAVNPVPKPPRAPGSNFTVFKSSNPIVKPTPSPRKKKRPAPEPPRSGPESLDTSPYSSLNSTPMKGSPCNSLRKVYKNKPAPKPPGSKDNQHLKIPQAQRHSLGTWKKKRPAPPRPHPPRRKVKVVPFKEILQESYDIEVQQAELERQGIRLEKGIREITLEDPQDSRLEDLTVQLFDVINMKNELFRRQTELMYLKKERKLEEEHAELEYEIRCLMEQPDEAKSDEDRIREEKLIDRLVEVVQMRNDIVDSLEMDRKKDCLDDSGISETLSGNSVLSHAIKKKKKWKKKLKFKHLRNTSTDLEKIPDVPEKEKKKKNKWINKLTKLET